MKTILRTCALCLKQFETEKETDLVGPCCTTDKVKTFEERLKNIISDKNEDR